MAIIDKATGLPWVVSPYYWKVQVEWSEYSSVPGAWLMLRKRKRWNSLAATFIEFGTADPRDEAAGRERRNYQHDLIKMDPDDYASAIAAAAETVLVEFAQNMEREEFNAKFRAAQKNLSGKYPPKTLAS